MTLFYDITTQGQHLCLNYLLIPGTMWPLPLIAFRFVHSLLCLCIVFKSLPPAILILKFHASYRTNTIKLAIPSAFRIVFRLNLQDEWHTYGG